MKARLVITPDLSLTLFVDEAPSAAQAMALSAKFFAELGREINIVVSEPEQHRHGVGYEHQHVGAAHTHADGSTHTH